MFLLSLVLTILWFRSCESYLDLLMDPHSSPKFAIREIDKDELIKIISNDTMMRNGRLEYLFEGSEQVCYVPNVTEFVYETEMDTLMNEEQMEKDLEKAVEIINSVFNERCFTLNPVLGKTSLWWQEKLCSNESRILLQSSKLEDNILGQTSDYRNIKSYRIANDGYEPYISQLLENGTICDLTGASRVAELRFKCDRSAKMPETYKSMEMKTCSYVVEILMADLCSIPSLYDQNSFLHERSISCFYGEDSLVSEPLIDLIRDYGFTFLQNNTYYLSPYNELANRPMLLYHTDPYLLEDSQSSLEEAFLGSFATAIPRLFQLELLEVSGNLTAKIGDQFLWRAPVVDNRGTVLMLLDLSMNFTSHSIFRINHNLTLLEDLPTNNFLYYDSFEERTQQEKDDGNDGNDTLLETIRNVKLDFKTDNTDEELFFDSSEQNTELLELLIEVLDDEFDAEIIWIEEI